jgi:hypothetical protein
MESKVEFGRAWSSGRHIKKGVFGVRELRSFFKKWLLRVTFLKSVSGTP